MQVTAETELMQNQKAAVIMAPDSSFEVLQTSDGNALFFSIGSDNALYATREQPASQTGWTRVNLSSTLASQFSGTTPVAKSFALSQNAQTLGFDLALVVTVNNVDHLYFSLNNPNTASSWSQGVAWTAIPFDAASITPPSPLKIADVFIMNIPPVPGAAGVQNCFVDIVRDPSSPIQLLDRYYIQPTSSTRWVRHNLAIDLTAGSVSSCLGHRTNDYVNGIYTFGTIGSEQELIFAQQYNAFRPTAPVTPARLTVPAGATAIASALNANGDTNLFVAANAGLYVFAPGNQGDGATPVLVVPSSTAGSPNTFAGTTSLSASTVGSKTTVWGRNAQDNLFHVTCAAGSEASSSAWTTPVPICPAVEAFAFYLNVKEASNVVFAHVSGQNDQNLVQLAQDAVTGEWNQHTILLPAPTTDSVVQVYTYTSHIVIGDATGVPAPNTAVTLTATSPVPVYINDIYYILSPTAPISTTSDELGTLTVIQETQSLTAVPFQVTITGPPAVVVQVDPLSKAMQTLSTVQTGAQLGAVQVQGSDGSQKSLVPSDVSTDSKNAAASAITQLLQVKSTLPADGSKQTAGTLSASSKVAVKAENTAAAAAAAPPTSWGVSIDKKNGLKYHEGDAAKQLLGVRSGSGKGSTKAVEGAQELLSVDSISSDLNVAAGDLFQWLDSAWDSVESFVVNVVENVYHFVVKIGDAVYDAILDCVAAVVSGIKFVFDQIKVLFEDLVAWLGFVFGWDDILRTHSVLKNMFLQYATYAVGQLDTVENDISQAFISIEDKVDAWANIKDNGATVSSQQQGGNSAAGVNSPQSNWAVYHCKNGAGTASTSYTDPSAPTTTGSGSTFDQLVGVLQSGLTGVEDDFKAAAEKFQTDIVDQFSSLTAEGIIKAIIAIITDALLDSTKNILVNAIGVFKLALEGLVDMLDATIDIPVISWLYKQISGGNDLSILDLVCLIAAIPATVFFKIASGVAPFPDTAHTQDLINAKDFATLQSLLNQTDALPQEHIAKLSSIRALEVKAVTLAPVDVANVVLNIVALPSALIVAVLSVLPKTKFTRGLAVVNYIPYVGPDIISAFYTSSSETTKTNDIITVMAFVKTCADNFGPLATEEGVAEAWAAGPSQVLETIINTVWLLPAIESIATASNPPASAWVTFAANMAFDIGGILSLMTIPEVGEPVQIVGKAAIIFLTEMYGYLCVAYGVLLTKGD